jgi:hypothetical protein
MIRHRAEIEALPGGLFLAQALEDLANRLDTPPLQIGTVRIYTGATSPESRILGSVGDLYLRTDGSTATTLYVKTSGSLTKTGWTAK